MKKFRKIRIVLCAMLAASLMTACGSSMDSSYKGGSKSESIAEPYFDSYGYASDSSESFYEESVAEADMSGTSKPAERVNDSARKLIKTYDLGVETEGFDGFVEMIQAKVVSLGGYIENLNTYNGGYYDYSSSRSRRSNMVVRIPVAKTDEFLGIIGESGNITSKSLSVDDVTLTYVDLESRKNTYKAEEQRILELLSRAETIEEILIIEDKLANIRYQLESMESQLRTYDNLVDYSTVNLTISEVVQYTAPEPETYGQRIVNAFTGGLKNVGKGFKNFSIGLAGALPGLVVFAAICFVIYLIVRSIVRNSNKKKAMKAAQAYQAGIQAMQAQAAQNQNMQNQTILAQNAVNNTTESDENNG